MTRLGALALVTVVLALTACGGESDEGAAEKTSGSPSVTTPSAVPTETEATEAPAEDRGEAPAPDHGEDGGSESQSVDDSQQTPTLAEYVRRADRVCRQAQGAIARHTAEYRKVAVALARGKIKLREYNRRGGRLTILSGQVAGRAVAELEALDRPASRRDTVEAYLDSAAEQAEILTAQGEALREGDNKRVATLDLRMGRATQRARRAAKRVGFRVCGGGR